jgi:hypothetical protein
MISVWHRLSWNTILVATLLWSVCTAGAQQVPSETFVIEISLPTPTIHVADDLIIKVVFSNPTDHVVRRGEGQNGGMDLEAVNEKGKDIGPQVSGSANISRIPRPNFSSLVSSSIKPGHKLSIEWPLRPDPKYLVPGAYRLRVHNRDTTTGAEIYSNAVTLTVVP